MTTHVLMITDRSGSMDQLANDVRGGHNAYLDQLTAEGADVRLTVFLFNTEVVLLDEEARPADATRLTVDNYITMGGTALLDAVGSALKRFAQSRNVNGTLLPADKVLVFIQTDGKENMSKTFTLDNIKSLVAEAENQHQWAFVFSGTAPDAWSTGMTLGLGHATANSAATGAATRARYRGYTNATNVAMSSQGPMRSATLSGLVQVDLDKENDSTP